jgi:DNA (cytosine-5)-methyltransferase 1
MKLVSLFSGAGGLDSGFASTNQFNTLLANEVLETPAETYLKNFQHSTMINDSIENLDFSIIENEEVDVVIGGPPCQDFSILRGSGNRQGTAVKRGRLYSHFIRGLKHVQPRIFVFENVQGLTSTNEGIAYKTITEDFSKLNMRWEEVKNLVGNHSKSDKIHGYELMFNDVVDFTKLGLPQLRKRLIIIGLRKDIAETANKTEILKLKEETKANLEGKNTVFGKCPLAPIEIFEGKTLSDSLNVNTLVKNLPSGNTIFILSSLIPLHYIVCFNKL